MRGVIIEHMFEELEGISEAEASAAALVALLNVKPGGLKWTEITAEVVEVGSARAVWEQHSTPQMFHLPGEPDPLSDALHSLREWRDESFRVLTITDADYPSRLRGIHQAPPILFARGEVRAEDRAVSVVGSRTASPGGLKLAAEVATVLCAEGLTVLSGLATGIDAAGHRAALDAGGRTVAFIGSGIRRYYPAENRDLQDEIAQEGLVLSQFWPDAPPRKQHFPMRNAAMSGYGLATVVVEAGEHSGARIQARLAVEHGRPVILSDLVVQRTQWGKSLLGRPAVYQASTAAEAVGIVEHLERARESLDNELQRLCAM